MKMSKRKKRKVGEIINCVIGQDDHGQFWWFEGTSANVPHGPFRTEEEAEDNFQTTMVGSDWTPQARSKLCEKAEGSCLGPPGFLL
jgi:hypothetical protein